MVISIMLVQPSNPLQARAEGSRAAHGLTQVKARPASARDAPSTPDAVARARVDWTMVIEKTKDAVLQHVCAAVDSASERPRRSRA